MRRWAAGDGWVLRWLSTVIVFAMILLVMLFAARNGVGP